MTGRNGGGCGATCWRGCRCRAAPAERRAGSSVRHESNELAILRIRQHVEQSVGPQLDVADALAQTFEQLVLGDDLVVFQFDAIEERELERADEQVAFP